MPKDSPRKNPQCCWSKNVAQILGIYIRQIGFLSPFAYYFYNGSVDVAFKNDTKSAICLIRRLLVECGEDEDTIFFVVFWILSEFEALA